MQPCSKEIDQVNKSWRGLTNSSHMNRGVTQVNQDQVVDQEVQQVRSDFGPNSVQGTVLVASTLWFAGVASAATLHTQQGESLGCVSPCPDGHRTALEMPQQLTQRDPTRTQVAKKVTGQVTRQFTRLSPGVARCEPHFT